jgi:hypothetical protein
VIIITLPIGRWLYDRIGAVMTLLRYQALFDRRPRGSRRPRLTSPSGW